MKPICCGDRDDAEQLLAASSDGLTIDEVNPIWLKTPAAPYTASLGEGIELDLAPLLSGLARLRQKFDLVIVEGVGGWMVPIRQNYFVSDLAREMNLPVMIVALNRLGCLNHTMLTVRSVEAAGLKCAGVVLNNPPAEADVATSTNADILRRISGVAMLPELGVKTESLPPEWCRILGS